MISISILALALSSFLHGGSVAAAQEAGTTAASGRITGRVTVPVTKVKKRALRGSAYRNRLSGAAARTTKSSTSASPLAEVIISAHPQVSAPMPEVAATPRIDQRDVRFVPRVLPVIVGSTVEFVNEDKVYHNVFSLTPGARFDIGRKARGVVHEQKIDALGPIELFCDIHPQMSATILSLDTPYFTRPDSSGAYVLDGLPTGEYEIRVFHPDFAGQTAILPLPAGAESRRDFVLTP